MLCTGLTNVTGILDIARRRVAERIRFVMLDSSDRGQSLIEFAVALPVLLLVLTGITSFGLAMNNYLLLTEATSVGARQIAISRSQTLDPCAVGAAAVYQAAPTLKQANFTFSYSFSGVNYSGTTCATASTNLKQGFPATITVNYPCSLVAYRYNFGASCSMQAQTTEVVQ